MNLLSIVERKAIIKGKEQATKKKYIGKQDKHHFEG